MHRLNLIVKFAGCGWFRHLLEVFADEAEDTIEQVTQVIGKISVIARVESARTIVTIVSKTKLAQQIITERIHAIGSDVGIHINEDTARLAQCLAILG